MSLELIITHQITFGLKFHQPSHLPQPSNSCSKALEEIHRSTGNWKFHSQSKYDCTHPEEKNRD